MSVQVTCTGCGKQLSASDKYAGWDVQCPQCKTMNRFPEQEEAKPAQEPVPKPTAPKDATSAPPASASAAPKPKPSPPRPAPPAASAPRSATVSRPPAATCGLCAKDFSVDSNRVKDPEGNIYHRRCYERELARLASAKTCAICGAPAMPEEAVQDTKGKIFHQACYEREKARRLGGAAAPTATAYPAPLPTPLQPLGGSSQLPDALPLPLPSPLGGNDLWADTGAPGSDPLGADMSGALGPALPYHAPAKMSTGMYVLLGIGGAVPVLLILAIVIYSLTKPPARTSVPGGTAAAPAAPGVPEAPVAPAAPKAAPAPGATVPVWQPDPALVEQLGPYEDVDGYQIRPPKGYQSVPSPVSPPPGVKVFAWAGAPRSDGTRATVLLMLIVPPPHEADIPLPEFLEKMLASVSRTRGGWQQTALESGQIDGLNFLRAGWQGSAPFVPVQMFGFDYAAKDRLTYISLRIQDVEPHRDQSLQLGTAAILSFRRKPGAA